MFFSLQLDAFEDNDIDGVSNSKDLCPNTSFDEMVDENGCPENQKYLGELTLILGSDFNMDESISTDYMFFTNYQYNQWEFSLSNSQRSSFDSNNNEIQSVGDMYLSLGYGVREENLYGKFTLGVKVPTGSSDVSTQERDYFAQLNLNYLFKDKFSLFSSLNYTLTGDNNKTNYINPLGYALGLGYMITENWYGSFSYQSSNSIYEGSEDYQSVSFFNSYTFTDNFFGTLNYMKGLDELSYDQTISLRLGVIFE
jgi:hypothetical protein